MKENIHPKYYPQAQIVCACGNVMTVGSTKEKIQVEICSNCHPFYTGKAKLIDTTGTVEKFKKRTEKASQIAAARPVKKARKTREQKSTNLKPAK